MTYENAERYLLLKQLLVTFSLVRSGASVTIGNIVYNEPMVVERIIHLLTEIEEYFTMPYALLRSPSIELELEGVSKYIDQLTTDEMEDGLALTMVNGLQDPAVLENSIYNYPIKNIFVKERAENLEKGVKYYYARQHAGSMVTASATAIDSIRRWVRFENKMNLAQCVVLANCIELVDWLFTYTNDLYGAQDGPAEF